MGIDDLLEACGGFGRYQLMVVAGILVHKLTLGWSMLQMSYAGFIPDWYCELDPDVWNGSLYGNETLEKCSIDGNLTGTDRELSCSKHRFEGNARTAISEWDLVCDLKWVKATVTSIQMVGVLLGAALTGQLADFVGRKKTLFAFSLLHCIFNISAAFSPSWQVFAAFRFFIGTGIGGLLVMTFPYPLEFLPIKWRPVLICIPIWMFSVGVFSITALILDNWSHLQIAVGIFGLPAMIGYCYLPESVRWLTIFGHHEEAEKIFRKMAVTNGVTPPDNIKSVLQKVYEEELAQSKHGKKYSYWDLFRGRKQIVATLVFSYLWFMISLVYYGISFGVASLSGNLYLNIFLLALVEVPGLVSTFYLNNKFGRKTTSLVLYALATLASAACLIVQFAMSSDQRGSYVTAFSLTAKLGIGTVWGVLQVWCSEQYPTVVRNLSYGLFNSVARIGGIAAPFALNLDDRQVMSYVIMTSLLALAFVVSFLVPETKGLALADSFDGQAALEMGKKPPLSTASGNGVKLPEKLAKGDNREKSNHFNNTNTATSPVSPYQYDNSSFKNDENSHNYKF